MPWYGWYSERQEKIYGYAHYVNKKGETVAITKITEDPNYKHPYNDAVYMGKLTHFIRVIKWNHIKKKGKEAFDSVIGEMKYECSDVSLSDPYKIIN
tara:strand:- start:2361 stop:2651 length:291 start_codon:yes stop_codon:yes gene_type:complete